MSCALTICAALVLANLGGEVAIGDYSAKVRSRVMAKIGEALQHGSGSAMLSGTVTYVGDECFFVQREDEGMKMIAERPLKLPAVGETVTVSGSPTLEGGRVVFRAEKWNLTGRAELPEPRMVSMDDLVYVGGDKRSVNWLRVSLAGRAIGITDTGFAMNVDGLPINVMMAKVPDFLDDCDRTHPRLVVKGVVELLLDQSALTGRDRYVMGVKLDVVSAEDVKLVADLEYLLARKDRRVLWMTVAVMAMLLVGLVCFVVVIIRQQRRLLRGRTIMAERKRMADDIHDTIEQHLVGAGMLLKLNRLKEAQDVLVRAKREIRDIVWGLKNDDMMRLSPAEMLRKLAHEETAKGICRVDTMLQGLPNTMDAAAMRDLSLIVREAIGNAVKHGGARKIAISSDHTENGGWRLRIANDGEQFDPQTAPGAKEGHFGIEGMRQRAFRLKATIDIARRKDGMVLTLERKS